MKAAAAVAGMIMLTLPAVTAPVPGLALGGAGVLLVLGSVTGRLGRLPWIGTAAAATAVAISVIGHLGVVSLAAEGLLILGYVILLDWPQHAQGAVRWRWLRQQAPAGLAGLIATGAVLASLAVSPPASPWIVLTGLACAVTAYLVALPRSGRVTLRGSGSQSPDAARMPGPPAGRP
jgi:hypothetical protein